MSVFPGTPEPGLTDAELRASPVPVSVSNLPGTQPVSGTVTATQATAANLKAQAQIIDSAGSTVSYAEIGTAGTPSADVVSVQGVSGGVAIPVSGTISSKVAGWDIPIHDYRALGYTSGNLTSVTYKTGGAGGTTVATLTLGYDGSGNLTSLTKT
jgi:hypothetical protein